MHAQTLRQYDRLGLVSPGRTPGRRPALQPAGRRAAPRGAAALAGGRRQPRRHQADHRARVAGRGAAGPGARAARGAARSPRTAGSPPRPPSRRAYRDATWCRSAGPARRWSSGDRGRSGERRRRAPATRTRPSSRLEREIGLLLRRSRAISARLAGELHPDLDGAAYGLLALLQDAGPLRASDLVARLGPGQEHGQPAGGHPGRPRAGRPRPPTPPTAGRRC